MPDIELTTVPTETAIDVADLLYFVDVSETPDAINQITAANLLGTNLSQLKALTDPGADRLLFWDDSAGAYVHLTLGTNLSITGTTLDAAGGGGLTIGGAVTGGGANRILFEDGSQNLAASANLTQTSTLALQAITPTGGEGIVIKPTTDYETLFKLKNSAGTLGLNIQLDGNTAPNFQATNQFIVYIDSNTVGTFSGHTNFSTTPALQVNQVVGTRPALGINGHMLMVEQTAPSAPAANGMHQWLEDNGSGKTRWMCRFGSGAAIQVAIEP